ncbi:MAG: SMP-30/gluconolactonase/LRE family protein, partial [Rhizobiales bacterium]|nr:SMP-30/gluconolactonase/LRE family protein [Hyphomicrobiales bacterium]
MAVDFEVIAEGLLFPEGPVWLADGSLIIVEVAGACVSRIAADGRKSVIAKPGGSPNGAALGPDGHLYVCNSGGFAWQCATVSYGPCPTPPTTAAAASNASPSRRAA